LLRALSWCLSSAAFTQWFFPFKGECLGFQ
jgi:hypothetical protein